MYAYFVDRFETDDHAQLAKKITRFQEVMGLGVDGKAGQQTIRESIKFDYFSAEGAEDPNKRAEIMNKFNEVVTLVQEGTLSFLSPKQERTALRALIMLDKTLLAQARTEL